MSQYQLNSTITDELKVKTWEQPRKEVILNPLWNENKVILKLFRRFGCPLCRLEAKVLSSYKTDLEKMGIKVIGIGFDELGLKEWIDGQFWDYPLYMDEDRTLYKKFELNRHNVIMGILTVFGSTEQKASKLAKEAKVGGNMTVGDGFQLGATILIDQGGKVSFTFKQNGYGDYPSLRELIKVAGGDPSFIKDSDETLVRECHSDQCKL